MTERLSTKAWVIGVDVNGEDFVELIMSKTLESAIESAQQMQVQVRVANVFTEERGEQIECGEHGARPGMPFEISGEVVWPESSDE